MSGAGSSLARALRAGAVGSWAVLSATAAHVAGSGEPPPAAVLMPVIPVVAGLTWWATGRRLAFPLALALITVPQLVIHVLSGYVHGHQQAPSAPMVAFHLVSAVLVAAAISYVERLCWLTWERLRTAGRRTPRIVCRVARSAARVVPSFLPHDTALDHVLVRRGPPQLLV